MARIGFSAAARGRQPARPPRSSCLLLAGAVVCGVVMGARDGQALRGACTADLRTGDEVVVEGRVAARGGAAGRGRIRVRLRGVSLRGERGGCSVPRLTARVVNAGARPDPGTVVRITGSWMAFETGEWPVSPDRSGMVTGSIITAGPGEGPGWGAVAAWAVRWRQAAAERLAARLPADVAPTAMGLLLAERDEIDPELRRRFTNAGLAHLLAISGMHVGLIAAGTVALLGLGLNRQARLPAALLLVTGYVLVIGAPPAARRALVMFAGYTFAHHRGWPLRSGELVGAAVLAALVVSPGSLLTPGLQLSFAGFVGVMAGLRLAETTAVVSGGGAAHRRSRWLDVTAGSAGALIATTPITALHFGQTTPVSLVSHFVAGPLVGIAIGGIAGALALPAWLAAPAADLTTGTLRVLHATAEAFSRVPGGHQVVSAPTLGGWLAWLCLLEGGRRWILTGRPRAAVVPASFTVAALVAGPLSVVADRGDALLCTLSVGQGDAAVLRTAGGRWLVFDGGPAWGQWNAGTAIVHPFLRRNGADRVELAVLSHPDMDHLGGLHGLLSVIAVERVADTGDPVPSRAYADFLVELDASGVQWIPAALGDRFRIDGASLTVLGPVPVSVPGPSARDRRDGRPASANATSLSFRLTVNGGFRYLNTGDATAAEELALVAAWPADSLRADLLKVGHHGSRSSSEAAFLRAVAPGLAVVSAGAGNRYGHPHPEVLERLAAAGIDRTWRTDRDGTMCVEIAADGRWRVRGESRWSTPGA